MTRSSAIPISSASPAPGSSASSWSSVDIGHRHLAEAVLDMYDGGPLAPEQILREIGGLGDAPEPLQLFSLNYHMNQDERFDEVGPAGKVLWHLTRLLPRLVRQVPTILQYKAIDFDRSLLSREMLQLEYDLDDEHSPLTSPRPDDEAQPHPHLSASAHRHPAHQLRDEIHLSRCQNAADRNHYDRCSRQTRIPLLGRP